MPVNMSIDDWKTIYSALLSELEFYNESNGIGMSLNVGFCENEDTLRISATMKKVEAILKGHGVDVADITF